MLLLVEAGLKLFLRVTKVDKELNHCRLIWLQHGRIFL